jgi:hypothetical protein
MAVNINVYNLGLRVKPNIAGMWLAFVLRIPEFWVRLWARKSPVRIEAFNSTPDRMLG